METTNPGGPLARLPLPASSRSIRPVLALMCVLIPALGGVVNREIRSGHAMAMLVLSLISAIAVGVSLATWGVPMNRKIVVGLMAHLETLGFIIMVVEPCTSLFAAPVGGHRAEFEFRPVSDYATGAMALQMLVSGVLALISMLVVATSRKT